MSRLNRELTRQAAALRAVPDPTGLRESVLSMPCKINIPYRCSHDCGYPIADPEQKGRLPVAACYNCHNYVERALNLDPESADAHCRIKMGRADTYDALRERGDLVKAIRD